MQQPEQVPTRGRPRTITRARIVDAGIGIGLPHITFVGVATALGVSHMALYKHVPSLEELKGLVAEEIFCRWEIPRFDDHPAGGLKAYLTVFATAICTFVKTHPGITPYVIRRLAATGPMLAKIDGHQNHIALACAIPKEQARWLLATVAFHCMAVADTVYAVAGRTPATDALRATEEREMEAELHRGIQALIVGALVMMNAHPEQAGKQAE